MCVSTPVCVCSHVHVCARAGKGDPLWAGDPSVLLRVASVSVGRWLCVSVVVVLVS